MPGQWTPGWPCGWAGNPVGIYKHFSPAVVVVAAVDEIDKLRGIPEGQRYRSGVVTSSEHQVEVVA